MFEESLSLNNLIDNLRGLQYQQERRFDPLFYLGGDVMHDVFLYAVSLWDIAESREITPRNHSGPLVLTSVSRHWSQFVTSSPRLWSYLLIDTDDEDILENLQLFLHLSRNRHLFIALHGNAPMCDAVVMDLLQVGDRIDTLVYPPNVPRSTLATVRFDLGAAHGQPICPWYKLEVHSVMQQRQHTNQYTFPISIRNLWMDGLCPLSKLGMLSNFQSLFSLSIRTGHDGFLSPVMEFKLGLPNLEKLNLQMALSSDRPVGKPIPMTCRNLKLLRLQYTLELNPDNPQEYPAPWLEFGAPEALQELHIHLAIHVVASPGSNYQQPQDVEGQLTRYFLSMQPKCWRRRPNPLGYSETGRYSSLEVTLSGKGNGNGILYDIGVIRDIAEASLLSEMPQLRELVTCKVLHAFPEHLRKLCLQSCNLPDPLSPIKFPSLVSLEIKADKLSHLSIVEHVLGPQLRDIRVHVGDGPGGVHKYDWQNITGNLLDHISIRIGMRRHKRDTRVLVLRLPRTHSLNISSPYVPLCLFLAESGPLPYTLRAELGDSRAAWQEDLMTRWITPSHSIPDLATFEKLVYLRQVVLDSGEYELRKQSPIDELFNLLAKNIDICPQLTSITVAQSPSSWPSLLHQLGMRNRKAILSKATKCIDELSFYHPLHATIIRWLTDTIKAKVLNTTEQPPVREGNAWPIRPFDKDKRIFRSCYICHITGMELGCLTHNTQSVDCGRERVDGTEIRTL